MNNVAQRKGLKHAKDKFHFDPNAETRRGNQGDLVESDSDEDYFDVNDPRTVEDLEKENIALKEQMIHQMVTAEQFLSIASVQYKDNPRWNNLNHEYEDDYNSNTYGMRSTMRTNLTKRYGSEVKLP